ncbi:SDR family oxidoreductase [Streptomyces virginiae]|uniref:SDR family oxidoreductase n=1 Tax=Streptomyces virginiae TaxID=1961 RepID=UPI003830EE2B
MTTCTPWRDRSVVVTGGTRGIGRAIAELFARCGAAVLLTGRDDEAAREVAAGLAQSTGGRVAGTGADLHDPYAAETLAAEAERLHGHLDVLCANAGIFPQKPLREMTAADIDEALAVNLRGSILATRACLSAMERAGHGRIVLTSSITGPTTGYTGWSHYGASKAGQLGFLRSAALELAPLGITVNAVLPGNVRTEGLDALGEDPVYAPPTRHTGPDPPTGHQVRVTVMLPLPAELVSSGATTTGAPVATAGFGSGWSLGQLRHRTRSCQAAGSRV